jgi:hypothetical protein
MVIPYGCFSNNLQGYYNLLFTTVHEYKQVAQIMSRSQTLKHPAAVNGSDPSIYLIQTGVVVAAVEEPWISHRHRHRYWHGPWMDGWMDG